MRKKEIGRGRLDEVGTQNRVIKDDSILGLNNWTDGGTTD